MIKKEGRYIIIFEVLTICNIYAPNKDDPAFFEAVFKEMLSFRCDEIIFGGDFNLVLDTLKDKRGGVTFEVFKSAEILPRQFRFNGHIKRLKSGGKRYTWIQNQPEVHCRLDFFFCKRKDCGKGFQS